MSSHQPPKGWGRPQRPVPLEALRRLEVRVPHLLTEHPRLGVLVAALHERERSTIGRAGWCDIVVDWDPAVSRTHAVVEAFGPLLTVEPAGATTNAPRVGETIVEARTPLADGQQVQLGSTTIEVRLPAEAALEDTVRVEGQGAAPVAALSRAERRVAGALAEHPEATNRELGELLGLAHETVRTHLRALLRKARAASDAAEDVDRRTVVEALRAAGLLDDGPAAGG